MSCKVYLLLFTIALTYLDCRCEGQSCFRTNQEPQKNCVTRECIPSLGCFRKNEICLCDGDCGYSCVKKNLDCGRPYPRRLSNGEINLRNGTKFNSIAIFKCNPDFTLTGSSVRRCLATGAWDGDKVRCRKYCADPGQTFMLFREEPSSKRGFKTNTILHYYCMPGQQLRGTANIKCKNNGQWSHSVPKCIIKPCPPPNLPANAAVGYPSKFDIKKSAKFGTRLTLKCNSGYFRIGVSQMICDMNGKWNDTGKSSFHCSPRSCGDPNGIKNGKRIGLVHTFKSKVKFECDKCYKLQGVSYRICNANGKWSDEQPSCQRVSCKSPAKFSNGSLNVISNDCGGKVMYSCHKGYVLSGPMERKCNETGQWSGKEPKCTIISCGVPLGINSTFLTYRANGFSYGSTVKFNCKSDYTLEGKKETRCNADGSWTNLTPQCLAPCRKFKQEPFYKVYIKKDGFRHGENITFGCKEHYVIDGQATLHCSNGTWNYSEPSCKAPCVPPKTVISTKKVFLHGETTAFKCNAGKILVGIVNSGGEVHCDNGYWKHDVNGKTINAPMNKFRCDKKKSSWDIFG